MKTLLFMLVVSLIPMTGTETTVTDSKGEVIYHEETGFSNVITWDDVSVTWDDI